MSLTIATPAPFSVPEQRLNSASFLPSPNIKRQVQKFWQNSPCDSWFTNEPRGTVAFYRSLDEHRYKVHARLQSAVGFEKTRGSVPWISLGCGAKRGAQILTATKFACTSLAKIGCDRRGYSILRDNSKPLDLSFLP